MSDPELQLIISNFSDQAIPSIFFEDNPYATRAKETLLRLVSDCQAPLFWGANDRACFKFMTSMMPDLHILHSQDLSGKTDCYIQFTVKKFLMTCELTEVDLLLKEMEASKDLSEDHAKMRIIRVYADHFLVHLLDYYKANNLLAKYNDQKTDAQPSFQSNVECLAYYFSRYFALDLPCVRERAISDSLLGASRAAIAQDINPFRVLNEVEFWADALAGSDPLNRLSRTAQLLAAALTLAAQSCYEPIPVSQLFTLPTAYALTFMVLCSEWDDMSFSALRSAVDEMKIDITKMPGLLTFLTKLKGAEKLTKIKISQGSSVKAKCRYFLGEANAGSIYTSLLSSVKTMLAKSDEAFDSSAFQTELERVATIVFNRPHVSGNPRENGARAAFLLYALTKISMANGVRYPIITNLGVQGEGITVADAYKLDGTLKADSSAASSSDAAAACAVTQSRAAVSASALVSQGSGSLIEMKSGPAIKGAVVMPPAVSGSAAAP